MYIIFSLHLSLCPYFLYFASSFKIFIHLRMLSQAFCKLFTPLETEKSSQKFVIIVNLPSGGWCRAHAKHLRAKSRTLSWSLKPWNNAIQMMYGSLGMPLVGFPLLLLWRNTTRPVLCVVFFTRWIALLNIIDADRVETAIELVIWHRLAVVHCECYADAAKMLYVVMLVILAILFHSTVEIWQ